MLNDISKWYSMTKCCVSQTLDLAVRADLTGKVIDVGLLDFLIHSNLMSDVCSKFCILRMSVTSWECWPYAGCQLQRNRHRWPNMGEARVLMDSGSLNGGWLSVERPAGVGARRDEASAVTSYL
jgi:hypothetical protein